MRTKLALVLILVPCLGLLSCAEQPDQEETAQEEAASTMEMAAMDMEALDEAMSQMEATWERAYESGDAAAVAALYTDDALYLAPYAEAARGRADIEARLTEGIGMMKDRHITIDRVDYGGSGDLSYGIGTYALEMRVGDAAEPISDNGKYITLAKRSAGGTWKIFAHIWNTSMSEAEVAEMLSNMAPASESSNM